MRRLNLPARSLFKFIGVSVNYFAVMRIRQGQSYRVKVFGQLMGINDTWHRSGLAADGAHDTLFTVKSYPNLLNF